LQGFKGPHQVQNSLSVKSLRNLMESMPRRLEEIIRREEYKTKY
jgi:hypothetical protein